MYEWPVQLLKNLCCSSICLFIAMHLSEDGHTSGRNMWGYIVCIIYFHTFMCVCCFYVSFRVLFFLHGTLETGTYSLVQAYILSTLFSSFIIEVLS